MRLRMVSVLSLLAVFASACIATPDDAENIDDDFDTHATLSDDAANEPIPGLNVDQADDEEPESTSSNEDALTATSGNNCVVGGLYCGGDKVTGDAKTLYRCNGKVTKPTVIEHCSAGCKVNSGTDDSCASAPSTCTPITKVPHASYLKWGLHPDASDALQYLHVTAGRVTQTIGSASASAGTHAQDGVAGGHAYSTATDLSASGMTDAQVKVFIKQLTSVGFAAYFRSPGHDGWPSSEARHIHVIWVGAPMKLLLRNQVRDWHVNKNALASHTQYSFYAWASCWRDTRWASDVNHNSASN